MENEAPGDDKSSSSDIFCLMRVGRNSDWLHLPENTSTSVGRGVVVNYQLLSASCPLMISRLHCLFYSNSGQWTVLDNKTPNGVWVNGKRIPALENYPLALGDSIQIGVPVNGNKVEFDYLFARRPHTDMKFCMARRTGVTTFFQENLKRKRTTEEAEPSTSEPKPSCHSAPDTSFAKPCPLSVKRRRQMKQTQQLQVDDKPSSDITNTSDLDKLQMFSQNILTLRAHVALLEGQHRHEDQEDTLTDTRDLLEMIRSKMNRMETFEKSFGEFKKQLEEQKTQQQEEQMKKQMEEALQEQKKVMDELAVSRQRFEEMLSAKNKELEVTKEEKEKARAQKDEVVTQVTEVLENELQCIICSELLIKAIILNCAHSFCSYCINQWRQKKDECPICREAIRSQTRCLALDNCIDGMVENLSVDMKARRQTLVTERS